MTLRTALAGTCMALAMLTAAACTQSNESVSGRDLECNEVPDDVCTILADDIVAMWSPASAARDGPIVRVQVKPVACIVVGRLVPDGARCWEAAAGTPDGGTLGGYYVERVGGVLTDDEGRIIGG